MRLLSLGLVCIGVLPGALAAGADLTVDPAATETATSFKTVQGAIDASAGREMTRVLIKRGRYEERLNIPRGRGNLVLIGDGKSPEETELVFHLKAGDPSARGAGDPATSVGTTGSASTTVNAGDVTAINLTFANSAGDNVGQAVAIKTNGDRLVFGDCRFVGFQDTLYLSGKGRVYLKDCYVTGDTDFIFGNAAAVFDHCTINSSDGGYITAANTGPEQAFGFVFLDCTLMAGKDVRAGSVYLGRPWQWDRGPKAAVAFVRTRMGPHIAPVGWHPWSVENNKEPGKTSRYGEVGSVDVDGKALDVSRRAAWAKALTSEEAGGYTVAKVLGGSDHWDPVKQLNDARK